MSLLWKFLGDIPGDAFELAYLTQLTEAIEKGYHHRMKLHSYPSIYNVGHSAIAELLKGEVIVEEKIEEDDGLDTSKDL